MKATIDFDDALYRRLKVEAARRGRTVRELVAEGVRLVLDAPPTDGSAGEGRALNSDGPAWFGSLRGYAQGVADHSLPAMRESVARGRRAERR